MYKTMTYNNNMSVFAHNDDFYKSYNDKKKKKKITVDNEVHTNMHV